MYLWLILGTVCISLYYTKNMYVYLEKKQRGKMGREDEDDEIYNIYLPNVYLKYITTVTLHTLLFLLQLS